MWIFVGSPTLRPQLETVLHRNAELIVVLTRCLFQINGEKRDKLLILMICSQDYSNGEITNIAITLYIYWAVMSMDKTNVHLGMDNLWAH